MFEHWSGLQVSAALFAVCMLVYLLVVFAGGDSGIKSILIIGMAIFGGGWGARILARSEAPRSNAWAKGVDAAMRDRQDYEQATWLAKEYHVDGASLFKQMEESLKEDSYNNRGSPMTPETAAVLTRHLSGRDDWLVLQEFLTSNSSRIDEDFVVSGADALRLVNMYIVESRKEEAQAMRDV